MQIAQEKQQMEYEVAEISGFKIVGKGLRVTMTDGENYRRIPKFWSDCVEDGTCTHLSLIANGKILPKQSILGICTDFNQEYDEFTYMIGVESGNGEVPSGMFEISVAPHKWAMFRAAGAVPDSIQAIWSRIWPDFFDKTDFQHADGPDIEIYPDGDQKKSDYVCEVWVPIVKK
jgi:AraC family transcriptional regulator